MDKKAQSISINTIIVAAIGLAVLVVLFLIFTGRLNIFSKGVGETASCDNACKSLNMDIGQSLDKERCTGTFVAGTYSDVTSGSVCCCINKLS